MPAESDFTIDVIDDNKDLISLTEAAKMVPVQVGRRKGVSYQTVHRWAHAGLKGVVLPTVTIQGTRKTTEEAVKYFLRATSHLASIRD